VAEAKSEAAQAAASKGVTKQFGNNEDAKEFLADRYGVSRSKMRTRAAIVEAAKSVGITIDWTE
jgi:predicted DsbA family dithiol-disulfide isomerase